MAEQMPSATVDLREWNARNHSLHNLHRSIVTIYVGPEQYPFYLHKGRLCQHSDYFERAFHGSFEEAKTGSLYLEDDGVEEFIVFEEWLYSQQLGDLEQSTNPSLVLVKVFCFADKVGIASLQNATLDAIRELATTQNIYARMLTAIAYAYGKTHEGSSLRRLLADLFAFNVDFEDVEWDLLTLPMEFIVDVTLTNKKRLPFRLAGEVADFDSGTERYYVPDLRTARKSRVLEEGSGNEHSDIPLENDKIHLPDAYDGKKPSKSKKKERKPTRAPLQEYSD